ncbi:MAG: hypothetical protein NUV61_01450 [Candidatus Azambacteria bacterium]|nr:hypothetical protein [Candidatus Azambacteria bacterium]
MENIEGKIESLGLSEKEAMVYIALLKAKEATVIQLARVTGIKRTSIYHCLESLIEKGLIMKIMKEDKAFYLAEDPKVSLDGLLRQKKTIIDAIVPELKNMFGTGAFQPEIKIYHNMNGMRKMISDSLSTKEKVYRYYISDLHVEDLVGEDFMDDFVRQRIKLGVKVFSLRTFSYRPAREKDVIHSKEFREVRFFPENVVIKPYISIYDDKVMVVSSKEEKFGFVIQSKSFADAQKAIFDMVWNSAAI